MIYRQDAELTLVSYKSAQNGDQHTRPDLPDGFETSARSSGGDPNHNEGQSATDYRGATDPEAFSLASRGMGDISERGLRDPVIEGIIDQGQLEAAYQV